MLADSELGDRQLPDQCSGAPGQIQTIIIKDNGDMTFPRHKIHIICNTYKLPIIELYM